MKVDFSKSFSPKRVITFFLLLIFLVFSYHFLRQVYLSLKTAENTAKIEIEVFSDNHEALNEVYFYTSSPHSSKNKMIKTGAKFFRERGYVHRVFFDLPDEDRLQFIKIRIQMGNFVYYFSNQEVTFLKGFYFIPLPQLNQTKLPFSFLKSTVNWKGDYFLLYDSFKIACIKSIKLIFPLILWLSLLALLITLGSFLATFRSFSTWFASSQYGHFLSLGLLTVSSVFLVVFFLYHYAVITDTHQVELREGAIVSTTDALLKGVNPYDYQNQPELTNVYGVLYSFLVSPFARVLGPTLIIHRIISAVFIFLVLAILFIYLSHQQVELSLILGGICLIYGSLLYMAPPCAKPDSLALFLFLCSLLIPSLLKNSPLSLTISGLCLVLVFFSKMHYILGIPALSFYLFLFDSKIKGMAYFVATSFGLLASCYFISIIFPTYLDNSFFNHINISGDELSWALKQFYYFSFYNFSLIIILSLYVSLFCHEYYGRLTSGIRYGQLTKREIKKYFNITDLNRPFLPSIFVDYFSYLVGLFILLLLFKLGKHTGTFLVYYFSLLTPFLVILVLLKLIKRDHLRIVFQLLLMINIPVFYFLVLPHLHLTGEQEAYEKVASWNKVEAIVRTHAAVYNHPAVTSIMLKNNRKIYNNGQSEYFIWGAERKAIFRLLFKENAMIRERNSEFFKEVTAKIQKRAFDVILIDGNDPFIDPIEMKKYYLLEDRVTIYMPFTRQEWVTEIWGRL